jgi:hypothetical protein
MELPGKVAKATKTYCNTRLSASFAICPVDAAIRPCARQFSGRFARNLSAGDGLKSHAVAPVRIGRDGFNPTRRGFNR